MDFSFTEKDECYRERLRQWLKMAFPYEETFGENKTIEEKASIYRMYQRKLFEGGYAGIRYPKNLSGAGGTLTEEIITMEETAPYGMRFSQNLNVAGLGMALPTIFMAGTPEQKEFYIPKILDGTHIWAQAFSEPNAGSDLANLSTSANKENEHYVLNGQKVWSTSAHVADYGLVLVRTLNSKPKHAGITYLIVDLKSKGVTIRPIKQNTGDSEFNEIFFDNVTVPVKNRLGKENNGWKVALGTLMFERSLGDIRDAAVFRVLFKRLLKTATTLQNEEGSVLTDPSFKKNLADLYIKMIVHRCLGLKSTYQLVKGNMPGPESSINKLLWAKLHHEFAETAISMQGIGGQLIDNLSYSVDKGFWQNELLRALGLSIGGGGTEIQKDIIAERVLGLPRS